MSSLVLQSLQWLLLEREGGRGLNGLVGRDVSDVTNLLWMASLSGADICPSSEQTLRLLWHEFVRLPYQNRGTQGKDGSM